MLSPNVSLVVSTKGLDVVPSIDWTSDKPSLLLSLTCHDVEVPRDDAPLSKPSEIEILPAEMFPQAVEQGQNPDTKPSRVLLN